MNLRFYIYWNDDYVRLTLSPEKSITLVSGGPDEEGYNITEEEYRHDGDGVICFIHTDGRDCDGPLETFYKGYCRADGLAQHPAFDHDTMPYWSRVSSSQRDRYAEAMGY